MAKRCHKRGPSIESEVRRVDDDWVARESARQSIWSKQQASNSFAMLPAAAISLIQQNAPRTAAKVSEPTQQAGLPPGSTALQPCLSLPSKCMDHRVLVNLASSCVSSITSISGYLGSSVHAQKAECLSALLHPRPCSDLNQRRDSSTIATAAMGTCTSRFQGWDPCRSTPAGQNGPLWCS